MNRKRNLKKVKTFKKKETLKIKNQKQSLPKKELKS